MGNAAERESENPPPRFVSRGAPVDFTLNLPLPVNRALPAWLGTPEILQQQTLNTLVIPLSPMAMAPPDLAITVVFLDLEGSFLRIIWDSPHDQKTLTQNLGEGVGTIHQRTLIISGDSLRSGGELRISAPGELVPVNAVRFAWLEKRQVLATRRSAEVQLLDGVDVFGPSDLSGLPRPKNEDTWEGWLLSAPLIEKIEPIEGGVAFLAQLEALPDQVLLTGKLAGIRPETEVRILVNGKDAGPISLPLPPLSDPGYGKDSSGGWYFAGWRHFSVSLPVTSLRVGENSFLLHWPQTAQGMEPVSAGDITLNLRYEPSDFNEPPGDVLGDIDAGALPEGF